MLETKHNLAYDDSPNTFHGVRFVLHGFDPDKEDEVRAKLLEGGGIDAVNYGPNCNHVIVDKLVYDDPICIAARRDSKILVTGLWVDHSFDVGMAVDTNSVMYCPMKDLNGIPGAESLVMCLTGYQRQDRDDIMTMVALMGASFSKPLIANKITHLICYKFEGEKYELAKKMKIQLVNHLWLEDCLKAWELLPETDYAKSGYELEMEAEAKDSEDETEDIDAIDLRRRSVVSPLNTRTVNKILHQSPLRQEVSKNTVYLSASENFANAGETSKSKLTPAKEIDCANKSTSSCARSPVKISSKAPSNMLDDIAITEKVEHATPSASRKTKKTPDANLSKLSSKSRKSSLPLRSERFGNNGSPVASNASKPGFNEGFDILLERHQDGANTPLKEPLLNLDEGQKSKSLPSKKKATASRGNSRSPLLSYSPQNFGLTPKTSNLPVSVSSNGNVSPANEEVSGDLDVLSHRLLDRIVSDVVDKTPSKAKSLHFDEGQTGKLSSKRKTTRSPISSRNPNKSMGSGAATETTELLISGSSIDASRRLAGDISPMNITSRLREEALNITTAEDRENCNGQELQHSPQGFEKSNLDDLNSSKSKNGENQSKPKKTKTFARKTLGSRKTILKGSTGKSKGPDNLQSAELKNGCTNHSNEAIPMEVTDDTAIPEKVAVVSPTTNEETKAPDDKEQNEFDIEVSTKAGASSSGKKISHKKKQANCKSVKAKEKSAKSAGVKNKAEEAEKSEKNELAESKSIGDDAGEGEITKSKKRPLSKSVQTKEKSAKSAGVQNNVDAEESSHGKKKKLPESKSIGDAGEGEITKSKKRPLSKSKTNKSKDSREEVKKDEEIETNVLASVTSKRPSKKLKSSNDEDKENEHATVKVNEAISENFKVKTEPAMFILSGHRLQRKEFQQVIKRLKGRVCRDSHNWSYQATHFIVPDPVKRTEKFFAAAASGCWILKTDYLTASNEAGRFLSEEAYEWNKKSLTEDGAINLQAPKKWRLLRERTGRGAFYGMRIIIYGECIAPPLDTLKRAVKAGDGTILATSPPYTRFLNSGVDFAIVSPVMPHQDIWIQEFLRHEVPCVVADYLVEYVCKPGYSLQRHVQYNTHAWAQKSLDNLTNRIEEAVVDPTTPGDDGDDDVACRACGSHDKGDEMLICGDESGRRGCGVGVHIDCLDPPLVSVPEEDWFCEECCRKKEAKKRGPKKQGSKSRK